MRSLPRWGEGNDSNASVFGALDSADQALPNYAAGSDGPISWHELLGVSGNTAERAIGYRK